MRSGPYQGLPDEATGFPAVFLIETLPLLWPAENWGPVEGIVVPVNGDDRAIVAVCRPFFEADSVGAYELYSFSCD